MRRGRAAVRARERLGLTNLVAAMLVVLVAAGCGTGTVSPSPVDASQTPYGSAAPTPGPGAIQVVTTTTVFADLIQQVGGSHVKAVSIVPRSGDVHTYEPKPDDVKAVASAKLLVMNGLGLDDWLEKMITSASAAGTPLIKLGEGNPGVELLPGEDAGTQNPHLWMDVKYAEVYVARIATELTAVDPAHATDYQAGAASYAARLETLDASVRARIAGIPEADRRMVTFHDAFPYYAREYGITIVGVAVEAPGQDPSAAYTAQLIDAIRSSGVKAIFSENQFPTKLVDQLASETGTKVVADLYDDALGDPPVTTYEGVIGWDTDRLVAALK